MRLGHFETALLDMGDRCPHPAIIRCVGFPKQTGCSRRTVNRGRRAPDSCRRRRRLVALDERGVTFRYKDYRLSGPARYCTMTLAPDEFIRRFLLHVLPKGFHRIRHYGLLATATCKANVARAKELIAAPLASIDPSTEHDDPDVATGAAADHRLPCPHCGGRMIIVESFGRSGEPRAPPP